MPDDTESQSTATVDHTEVNPSGPALVIDSCRNVVDLKVGDRDESDRKVDRIYFCDPEYVIYYAVAADSAVAPGSRPNNWFWRLSRPLRSATAANSAHGDGVYVQLAADTEKRKILWQSLLPLEVESAKVQALYRSRSRRSEYYDTRIAIALKFALIGNAVEALKTVGAVKADIIAERGIWGRAQYLFFALILSVVFFLCLLVLSRHAIFGGLSSLWLGTQAGFIGAFVSIIITIPGRRVRFDINAYVGMIDVAIRLLAGALTGWVVVFLLSIMLPSQPGGQDGVHATQLAAPLALLLGLAAGFAERLVPDLLPSGGLPRYGGAPTDSSDSERYENEYRMARRRFQVLGGQEREPPRFRFPELDFSEDRSTANSLILLRKHAEDWAQHFILYYETRARARMVMANALRVAAIFFLLIGAALAAGRLLPPDWQKKIVAATLSSLNPAPETVPAELGLVLFGVAAGLLVADRFGNISTNWLRYRATAMVLERRLLEFRLAWWEAILAPSEEPKDGSPTSSIAKSNAIAQMNTIQAFFAATFDLVDNESREWAAAFQKTQGDFESYLKVAQETGVQRRTVAKSGSRSG